MFAEQPDRDEMELADYWRVIRRRWIWTLTPIVILATLANVYTTRQDPSYSATARVLLADSAAQNALDPGSQSTGFLSRELANEISLALGDEVTARVEEEVGELPTVAISADTGADVLIFTARAATAVEAARGANVWAEQYVAAKQSESASSITTAVGQFRDRLEELRLQRTELRAPLDDLDDRLAQTLVDETRAQLQRDRDRLANDLAPELALIEAETAAIAASITELQLSGELAASGTARVLQVAAPPEAPVNGSRARAVALGIAIGAVLGAALALLIENLDRSIKSASDIASVVSVPVLAEIPQPKRSERGNELGLLSATEPNSAIANGYHQARSALLFAQLDRPMRSVLITSANQGEGKTTTSSNIAWSMAGVSQQVALVDIDLRRPRLHHVYGTTNDHGLTDHLTAGVPLHELARDLTTSSMSLRLLTTGALPPSPSDLIASAAFGETMRTLTDGADLVVLDGPPVLPVADTLALTSLVDLTILVVHAGRTKKDELREATRRIIASGGRVGGIIIVGVKKSNSYGNYKYEGDAAATPQAPEAIIISEPEAAKLNGKAKAAAQLSQINR